MYWLTECRIISNPKKQYCRQYEQTLRTVLFFEGSLGFLIKLSKTGCKELWYEVTLRFSYFPLLLNPYFFASTVIFQIGTDDQQMSLFTPSQVTISVINLSLLCKNIQQRSNKIIKVTFYPCLSAKAQGLLEGMQTYYAINVQWKPVLFQD